VAIIKLKRGLRSELDSAASSNELALAEPYLITDEDRLVIGTSTSTYVEIAKLSETGGSGTDVWIGTLPPENTTLYPLWWSSEDGTLSIFYGDSWVEISGGGSSGSSTEILTRVQLDAKAAATELSSGSFYFISDENRLAVGINTASYIEFIQKEQTTEDGRNLLAATLDVQKDIIVNEESALASLQQSILFSKLAKNIIQVTVR
jgi:hypothetical protein